MSKPKGATKKPKTDWEAIRREYVEAPSKAERPTLEQLADHHACSPSYLREKASAEKWKEQAEAFLDSVRSQRQEKTSAAIATDQSKWDEDCFKVARNTLQQVHLHLKKSFEAQQALSMKELDALTRSLERIHRLGKVALGEEKVADPAQETAEALVELSQMSPQQLAQLYQESLKPPGAE